MPNEPFGVIIVKLFLVLVAALATVALIKEL